DCVMNKREYIGSSLIGPSTVQAPRGCAISAGLMRDAQSTYKSMPFMARRVDWFGKKHNDGTSRLVLAKYSSQSNSMKLALPARCLMCIVSDVGMSCAAAVVQMRAVIRVRAIRFMVCLLCALGLIP